MLLVSQFSLYKWVFNIITNSILLNQMDSWRVKTIEKGNAEGEID